MKRIVDGLLYDTETAEEVASFSRGHSGDFDSVSETLYKTKSGNWFVHGEGGARTRWARHHGNESSGGEGILALSRDEALDWIELNEIDANLAVEHLSVEEA